VSDAFVLFETQKLWSIFMLELYIDVMVSAHPSVLWHCWLGDRKIIWYNITSNPLRFFGRPSSNPDQNRLTVWYCTSLPRFSWNTGC